MKSGDKFQAIYKYNTVYGIILSVTDTIIHCDFFKDNKKIYSNVSTPIDWWSEHYKVIIPRKNNIAHAAKNMK